MPSSGYSGNQNIQGEGCRQPIADFHVRKLGSQQQLYSSWAHPHTVWGNVSPVLMLNPVRLPGVGPAHLLHFPINVGDGHDDPLPVSIPV